jgi:hypothetical protein
MDRQGLSIDRAVLTQHRVVASQSHWTGKLPKAAGLSDDEVHG